MLIHTSIFKNNRWHKHNVLLKVAVQIVGNDHKFNLMKFKNNKICPSDHLKTMAICILLKNGTVKFLKYLHISLILKKGIFT